MDVFSEVGAVVGRELRRTFRSAKGIVLLILALLGGTGVTLALVKLEQFQKDKLGDVPTEQLRDARQAALTEAFGDPEMGRYLADAPAILLALLVLTVWLGPMLIALMGFDSISADLQHKTVRFWTVRIRRPSYFVGKVLGLWSVVSIVTLTMSVLTWLITVARGEAPLGEALSWGVRFWFASLPISAAWCGLATLVSSQFKTPILSLLVIFAAFFGVWLTYVIGGLSGATALTYVYPNSYDSWLISPKLDRSLGGAGICLAMGALCTAAGTMLFVRRDV